MNWKTRLKFQKKKVVCYLSFVIRARAGIPIYLACLDPLAFLFRIIINKEKVSK